MTGVAVNIWTDYERDAWRPPDEITVAEWADRYRMLDAKNHAEPGPWRTDRVPYLREIMGAFTDPAYEEVAFMASTQIGKTSCIENMIGYISDQDPAPALLVQAREDDVFSFAHNRLRAMFSECDRLNVRCPNGDAANLTQKEFRLDLMTAYFAGSNSPAALSSKPVRYLFLDETDKYPAFSGREASPIKLARERTRTFWNRKIFKSSTPTTKHGYIWQEYERSDKRRFYVPCPHCGHYQILYFQNIIVPKDERDPGKIREKRLAWYECEACRGKIRDRHKERMLASGVWAGDGQRVETGGVVKGERIRGVHAGFWINCLYSPWLTFSEIMAEFLECRDDDADLMNFLNSWLAEVWVEKAEYRDSTQLERRRVDYPARHVPQGAVLLTAGVDVQKAVFYYVVRAWGVNMKSWLVDEGELPGDTLEEIEDQILTMKYPVHGDEKTALGVKLCNVDTGYRTDEVYEFCRRRPGVRPVKGASGNAQRPFWSSMVDVDNRTGKRVKHGGVRLWMLDTDYFKDFIFRRMMLPPENDFAWLFHRDVSLDYLDQITSEKRVVVKRGRIEVEEWHPKKAGAKNHLWDCEVYAAAAAFMFRKIIDKLGKRKAEAPAVKEAEGVVPLDMKQRRRATQRGQRPWVAGGAWMDGF